MVKNPPANAGDVRDTGSIPGLGRSPGEGNGNSLQYSCLGNSMDRGALWAIVHGVPESDTTERLNNNNVFLEHRWELSPVRHALMASLVAQMVKDLPVMQETRVRSLGQEDPLEKEMATHSSILASRISWAEEPCRLQSMGSRRVRHD